jgi:putative ABC transport system ATP-binding protein
MNQRRPVLDVHDLTVEYPSGDYVVRPLDGLSFSCDDGELVVVLGPSGCGKTTLLSCLAGLLTPTAGTIRYREISVTGLTGTALAAYRRHTVGVVFQAFNLIPSLSALRNVMAPLELAGVRARAARTRAVELLERVGLSDRMNNRPASLSGGQQQRVAIARALVHDPPLVIADEPTAHLDYVQVDSILQLVRSLASPGRTVLVATHDERLVRIADRVIHLVPEAAPPPDAPVSVHLAPDEVLFEQGDASDLVYVVEQGEVLIYRLDPYGAEVRLTTIRPGGYFGELGPLLGLPRSATARAVGAVVLTGYSPDMFRARQPMLQDRDGAGVPDPPRLAGMPEVPAVSDG